MRRWTRFLILLAGSCAAAQGGLALAQKLPPSKPVYDQYQPNRVLRTGRQECMSNEDPIGAYCVRMCQKGYVVVPDSDPPRCRSIEPLPPGQAAGPIRMETAPVPKPSGPQKPYVPSGKH
jgi:hypothetical protein